MFHGDLGNDVLSEWQSIVNFMATSLCVPACFIVRHTSKGYELLNASTNSENPYCAGMINAEDSNIFCRIVVSTGKMLAVNNATNMKEWETYPCVQDDHFNTYVGFPILNPDGSVFGTLCIMDFKCCPKNNIYAETLKHFKSIVEFDLHILEKLKNVTELSLRDDLTGLYNRRGFNILVQKQFQLGVRTHKKFAVLILDIDLLKKINDHHGHAAGDRAIVLLAQALNNVCRESDLVARVGGDEYLMAVYLNDESEIRGIIKRIRIYLENNPLHSGVLNFSWGGCVKVIDELKHFNLSALMSEADKALYAEKDRRNIRLQP